LKLDAPSTFTGQIVGFSGDGTLAGSDHIDLAGLTYNSSIQSDSTYNSSTGVLSVNNGTTVDLLQFTGSYSLANFEFASDGNGGTIVYDPPVHQTGSGFPSSANGSSVHAIAMPDLGSRDHVLPSGPAPSPYATLAGLLDQYLAVGPHHPSGVSRTSWTGSQQAWLGGDKEFLTRPQS
jgi:hypothetical protein